MFWTGILYIVFVFYGIYGIAFCTYLIHTLWKEHKAERYNRIQREYDQIIPQETTIRMVNINNNNNQVLATIQEEIVFEDPIVSI